MVDPCFSRLEDIDVAMKKCPFLHNIAQTHGTEYASSLACKQTCPSGQDGAHRPLLVDDGRDYSSTFALFHGRGGVLPLPHLSVTGPKVLYPLDQPALLPEPERSKCPFSFGKPSSDSPGFVSPLFAAPFASMSMSWGSNWFNIHQLFQKHLNQHRAQQRKPPQQPQQPQSSSVGGVSGPGPGGPGKLGAHSAGPGGGGGKCPLRKSLGPLAGVVFNKHGHLSCPEPIVKMRAALAATRPVRELRPQALPIKLLAIAMTTAALNVPCGIWREHTEKFSSQWFLAVHATIPFIAMLRKAVVMPKYAILFTICAAIAGQAMGAKLERKRMVAQARDELGGLTRASATTIAAGRAAPASGGGRHATAAALPVASMLLFAQQQPLERPAGSVLSCVAAQHGPALWVGTGDLGAEGGGGCSELPAAAGGLCLPGAVGATSTARSTGLHAGQKDRQQQQQPGQLQFRIKMRSGRSLVAAARRSAGSGGGGARMLMTSGGAAVPSAGAVAIVPAVTC